MVMAAPTREKEHLARLLADGTLRVHAQATYESRAGIGRAHGGCHYPPKASSPSASSDPQTST
jgi:hypothetical protein